MSKMAADGHLEMTALSRVTLASAGLSSSFLYTPRANSVSKDCSSKNPHPLVDGNHFSGKGGGIQTAQIRGVCW